ncbi:TonB-dependent receptor plug domain-containing protein [Endozoicomonadaceae bacterium StTr2]
MKQGMAVASSLALVCSFQTYADDSSQLDDSSTAKQQEKQDTVIVVRDRADQLLTSKKLLTSEDIQQRPLGNGNLSDLLSSEPAVRLSSKNSTGMNQGEIKPSDISIHGSTAYQNAFILDGMNINNDIDPADNGLGVTNANLQSDEQGFYLDTRMLDSVTVRDANVSAEFGGFTGGVISAESKSWNGDQDAHGSIFIRHNRSSWNKTHVDGSLDFDSKHNDLANPSRFQPDYKKSTFGGTFSSGLTENLGVTGSYSRRNSTIPSVSLGGASARFDPEKGLETFTTQDKIKDQRRRSDNFFTKFTWYAAPATTLHSSVSLSNYKSDEFLNGVANSDYTTDHNGLATQFSLEQIFQSGKLDLDLQLQRMDDKRDSEVNQSVTLRKVVDFKLSEAKSGGPGDLNTRKDRVNLKGKFNFNSVNLWGYNHQFLVGAEMNHTKARFERKETYKRLTFVDQPPFLNVDPKKPNQVTAFFAGTSRASYNQYALFFEDTIEVNDFSFRPGVRVDRDNFIRRTNVAPRFSASWDVLGNGDTVINTGANRYFGRSMLTYALYEAQNAGLRNCYFDCDLNAPIDSSKWNSTPDFEGLDSLKTPYSDELTLGLKQNWQNTVWNLRTVYRNNKDEVQSQRKYPDSRSSDQRSVRHFTNGGKTRHLGIALTVANRAPIQWQNTSHRLTASLSWQKTVSNTPKDIGYKSTDPNSSLDTSKVWYDGKIIDASKLPATDFNIPWKLALHWTAEHPGMGLTLFNNWQWSSRYDQPTRHDNSAHYDPDTKKRYAKYSKVKIGDSFSWDMRLQWKPAMTEGLTTAIEVNNLLNNKNVASTLINDGKQVKTYKPGRQIWLQLGYEF